MACRTGMWDAGALLLPDLPNRRLICCSLGLCWALLPSCLPSVCMPCCMAVRSSLTQLTWRATSVSSFNASPSFSCFPMLRISWTCSGQRCGMRRGGARCMLRVTCQPSADLGLAERSAGITNARHPRQLGHRGNACAPNLRCPRLCELEVWRPRARSAPASPPQPDR